MPEMDGLEFITAIRQMGDARIVALSSDGKHRHATLTDSARIVGADSVLRKPFEPDALIDALEEIL